MRADPSSVQRPSRVRTPTVLQMEAVECGAAALGIVLGYFGRVIPLPELRQICGVSRDGSKASKVLKAARSHGLQGEGYKKELKSLWQLPFPYIVFWNFNHFLVVEGRRGETVYLNDPATGPRKVSLREFDEGYTGVVLALKPGPDFRKSGKKPSVVTALRRRLSSSYSILLYCIIAGILLVVPGMATAIFTQVFVDDILIQGLNDWLRPLLVGLVLAAGMTWALKALQLLFLRRLEIKLAVGTSGRFLWHTLRLPVGFYAQRYAGEVASRVNLNDKVAEALSGKLATTAIGVVTMSLYVLIMVTYDWLLTAISVAFALVSFVVLQMAARRRVDANIRLGMEMGKSLGVSISGLQSMETLKASGLESDFFARWSGYHARALNTMQELGIGDRVINALPPLLSSLASVALLSVGGLRVMHGDLSLGMLVAFQSLMLNFLRPVGDLVSLGSTLQDLVGDLDRLDDLLGNPVDPQLGGEEPQLDGDRDCRLQGHVELRKVTFGYSPLEQPLIENLDLVLKSGQRVALIGGSGSGKTTVAKLVCGLYQPWSGEILFDGKPRSALPRQVLANSMAMVDQDMFMMAGTVRENLTLWDSTVPDSDLIQACKDAAIHEVVVAMQGGYDAWLIEGAVNLSGGQRQRLELARALAVNPSILVLDEATSALDTKIEQTVDQNLRKRGCTCIIVAHRLSTIRDCDEILVFERGKVVQRGTHETLWREGGLYARLLTSEGETLPGAQHGQLK